MRDRPLPLIDAALDIAAWAPAKRSKHTDSARVPWHMIEELRRTLEAQGIDWKNVQRIRRNDERRAARDWSLPHERKAGS